jgi:hypothetical protein
MKQIGMVSFQYGIQGCVLIFIYNLLSFQLSFKTARHTLTLPVFLMTVNMWFLTLRGEYELQVFGNKVSRKTSGPERDSSI